MTHGVFEIFISFKSFRLDLIVHNTKPGLNFQPICAKDIV